MGTSQVPSSTRRELDRDLLAGIFMLLCAPSEPAALDEIPSALAAVLAPFSRRLPPSVATFSHLPIVKQWIDAAAVAESEGLHDAAWDVLGRLVERAVPELSAEDASALVAFVWARRGRIARMASRFDDADACYREAMRLAVRAPEAERWRDGYPHAVLGLSVLSLRRGNYPRAIRLARRVLAPGRRVPVPYRVQAHLMLGLTYRKRRSFRTAVRHLWSAYDLLAVGDGRRAEVLVGLAEVASDAGALDAALEALLAVLEGPSLPRIALPTLASLVDVVRRGTGSHGEQARMGMIERSRWGVRALEARSEPTAAARLMGYAQEELGGGSAHGHPTERCLLALALAEWSVLLGDAVGVENTLRIAEQEANGHQLFELQFRAERVRAEWSGRLSDEVRSATREDPEKVSLGTSAIMWKRYRSVRSSEHDDATPSTLVSL